MKNNRSSKSTVCALSILLLAILPATALFGQDDKTNTHVEASADATLINDLQHVIVGTFALDVPTNWKRFNANEMDDLRRQYVTQSEEIYRQFSGSDDSSKTVDVVAFHVENNAGSFVIVSFTVPPQSNLLTLLKSQVMDKMDWGIREGHIRKYMGLVPVDNGKFTGFYTKTIGNSGGVEVSGGLEHKRLKNTIIQLTLLCPKAWDEAKATNTLTSVLESVMPKDKAQDITRKPAVVQWPFICSEDTHQMYVTGKIKEVTSECIIIDSAPTVFQISSMTTIIDKKVGISWNELQILLKTGDIVTIGASYDSNPMGGIWKPEYTASSVRKGCMYLKEGEPGVIRDEQGNQIMRMGMRLGRD